jgi:hypothetical protein
MDFSNANGNWIVRKWRSPYVIVLGKGTFAYYWRRSIYIYRTHFTGADRLTFKDCDHYIKIRYALLRCRTLFSLHHKRAKERTLSISHAAPWCRFHPENLPVTQIVLKFRVRYGTWSFITMYTKADPYSEPDESSPQPHISFLYDQSYHNAHIYD